MPIKIVISKSKPINGELRIVRKFILFPKILNNIIVWCQYINVLQECIQIYTESKMGSDYCWKDKKFILDDISDIRNHINTYNKNLNATNKKIK